jgi:DNA invertase Pin-like site-specific DNA recombinase
VFIRHSNELEVAKLDRLGRSTGELLNLLHKLESKGAALIVLEPTFRRRTRLALSW